MKQHKISIYGSGRAAVCLFTLSLAACSGSLDTPPGGSGTAGTDPNAPGGVNNGTAGTGSDPGTMMNPPVMGNPPATATPPDVNRVNIHRLNAVEYDNTARDLLGVATTPAPAFINDEEQDGFDNIAAAFGMTEAQFEQYYNAADGLAEAAFADPALASRIMTCATPDAACLGQLITTFGARAWRRPLNAAEVTRLTTLATDAVALGEDAAGAMKQVVKTMMTSVPFLYRIELDSDPNSGAAHALNGYELASRLSYLGWSSMPDDAMFALAANGTLVNSEVITAEVDRMLASPKGAQFAENFAGQWLGFRKLKETHVVDATVFPEFNDQMRASMVQEGLQYFNQFLIGDKQMTEFFTADVKNLPGITGTPTRNADAADTRVGFMGLSSFLTFSSFSYRTAPTLRGKWVLENLLCQDIPAPPANVPKLDDPAATPPAELQSENVRVRLEAHRQMEPACNACHTLLDPIGLGLENYDAIGQFRTTYDNGDQIDASGQLPTGETFAGVQQLATILSTDTRLNDCVSDRMMTYALSRELGPSDEPYLAQIRTGWAAGGYGLRGLLKQIVLNDTFRFRRGEGAVQ
jgi:hypothetical protein